jgi:hypothetical protein
MDAPNAEEPTLDDISKDASTSSLHFGIKQDGSTLAYVASKHAISTK